MATLQTNTAYRMGERYGRHPDDGKYPGTLIIVEGIDGSGKSAQIDRASEMAQQSQPGNAIHPVEASPIENGAPRCGAKVGGPLTGKSFSLIHPPISLEPGSRADCQPFGRGPSFWQRPTGS